jgi:outer membrane protein OmpA-like peptidoglycan-associated protein
MGSVCRSPYVTAGVSSFAHWTLGEYDLLHKKQRESDLCDGHTDRSEMPRGETMRYSITIALAFVGLVSSLILPRTVYAQAGYTDFRDRSYTVEELELALFGQTRSIGRPSPQSPPSPANPPAGPTAALNVQFATNSAEILPQYRPDLDKLGQVLTRHGQATIEIAGHTDSVGSHQVNQLLSERRAESVKRYLVQNFSIPEERLIAKGYGENQPRETNHTLRGRSVNRRVEAVRLAP